MNILERYWKRLAATVDIDKSGIEQILAELKDEIIGQKNFYDIMETLNSEFRLYNIYFTLSLESMIDIPKYDMSTLFTGEIEVRCTVKFYNKLAEHENIYQFLTNKLTHDLEHEVIHRIELKKTKELPQSSDKHTSVDDYFSDINEVQAYASNAANELLDLYSKEEAINKLKTMDPSLKKSRTFNIYWSLYNKTKDEYVWHRFLRYVTDHINPRENLPDALDV